MAKIGPKLQCYKSLENKYPILKCTPMNTKLNKYGIYSRKILDNFLFLLKILDWKLKKFPKYLNQIKV